MISWEPYTDWPDNNPPTYARDEMIQAKTRLWELLQESSLIHVSHVDERGEPVSQPLRFSAEQTENGRLALFVDAADSGMLTLLQGRRRIRLSVSVFRAVGFENRRELRSAQIQATAVLERLTRNLGTLPPGLMAARIEPVQCAWHDTYLRPPRGTILFGEGDS